MSHDERGMDALLKRYRPLMQYILVPILTNSYDQEEYPSKVVMRVWDTIELLDHRREAGSLADCTHQKKSFFVRNGKTQLLCSTGSCLSKKWYCSTENITMYRPRLQLPMGSSHRRKAILFEKVTM